MLIPWRVLFSSFLLLCQLVVFDGRILNSQDLKKKKNMGGSSCRFGVGSKVKVSSILEGRLASIIITW